MARVGVFAIKDTALGAFSRPMYFASKGVAVRAFSDEVNRSAADNNLHNHADDFELWYLGEFVEENGTFDQGTDGAPYMLAEGQNVKR